jgi:hypothetical protein
MSRKDRILAKLAQAGLMREDNDRVAHDYWKSVLTKKERLKYKGGFEEFLKKNPSDSRMNSRDNMRNALRRKQRGGESAATQIGRDMWRGTKRLARKTLGSSGVEALMMSPAGRGIAGSTALGTKLLGATARRFAPTLSKAVAGSGAAAAGMGAAGAAGGGRLAGLFASNSTRFGGAMAQHMARAATAAKPALGRAAKRSLIGAGVGTVAGTGLGVAEHAVTGRGLGSSILRNVAQTAPVGAMAANVPAATRATPFKGPAGARPSDTAAAAGGFVNALGRGAGNLAARGVGGAATFGATWGGLQGVAQNSASGVIKGMARGAVEGATNPWAVGGSALAGSVRLPKGKIRPGAPTPAAATAASKGRLANAKQKLLSAGKRGGMGAANTVRNVGAAAVPVAAVAPFAGVQRGQAYAGQRGVGLASGRLSRPSTNQVVARNVVGAQQSIQRSIAAARAKRLGRPMTQPAPAITPKTSPMGTAQPKVKATPAPKVTQPTLKLNPAPKLRPSRISGRV